MNPSENENIDPAEVAKFGGQPDDWWAFEGPFATLHHINPPRLDFIERSAALRGTRVLDIGCGGGILAEGMVARGAMVTGIDASEGALTAARNRSTEVGSGIQYQQVTAEDFASRTDDRFDTVTCLELLEHVPEPARLIAAAAELTRDGGHLIISTLNRTPRAFLQAIVAAEYLIKALPRGTHDYQRFIRPSELVDWCRPARLELLHLCGLGYNPFSHTAWLREDVSVNYLACFRRAD
ncbi:MAG: bifunctional 2-polyprenyl-6-hydroxyphenol methylase/3-demethylubiquinol 3-O-methyltransferase UbiG [Gammaproteobacteria bacterium]|nr:bifunctional 2-polyprenyl-6-hydroxyphenol methylase/3-demethylubiquinol 3-O-methyltransferase UbiG [Gammaproteobacteria bacterium]